jgi:hypothetical protein
MAPNKNPQKIPNVKHECITCHYFTCNKKDFLKHLLTAKHLRLTNPNEKSPKIPKNPQNNQNAQYECDCGKNYRHMSSLCNHKKVCTYTKTKAQESSPDIESDDFEINEKNLILMLLKENKELKTMMLEQQNMVIDICKHGTHNNNSNNTNSHNKTFNLNMFLNETCKDAMNISEFVDSIKFQLSDLESVGELGYVKGISNIIVKNLNALDITQRPVHCADKKREVLYIKDDNKWEKEDSDNRKLRTMIKRVALKNYKQVREFKEKYPDCNKSESKYSDKYNKIIVESMGGEGDNERENEDKIIRNISREVVIDKDCY